jgi:hypothetical protein
MDKIKEIDVTQQEFAELKDYLTPRRFLILEGDFEVGEVVKIYHKYNCIDIDITHIQKCGSKTVIGFKFV